MNDTAPRFMMATKAMSGGIQPIDISRDEPDLCQVWSEAGDNYIGAWETGFGFVNVRFPKATTRPLTDEEITRYSTGVFDAPWGRWNLTPEQLRGESSDVAKPSTRLAAEIQEGR